MASRMVHLGYGKWVRADRVFAVVPLEAGERGDGRRTYVHVEGLVEPLVASRSERAILFLYWLVSGYGLRASRALAALAVTVVVFAFLFDAWGFVRDEGYGGALLFSLESTTSLLRGTAHDLTTAGEVFWVVLRLLGPVFFGLVLLSLRGRVKR